MDPSAGVRADSIDAPLAGVTMKSSTPLRILGGAVLGLAALGVVSTASAADVKWSYPAIAGYGPVHVWPDVTMKPSPGETYKAVFDVTKPSKKPGKVSPALTHVARAVNVFAAAKVPLDHLKFVVIVHGKATPIILNDKAYRAKYGVANPNLKIIAALRKAGVKVLVCGNALADMKFDPQEVNPDVKVALSALSTLVILEDQGYALMRM
jgi:Uncharacterized conserved protein